MNAAILALSLAVTNGVAHVRFTAPVAGIYTLEFSEDSRFWRPVCRPVTCDKACEVGITDAGEAACRFYRVRFQ